MSNIARAINPRIAAETLKATMNKERWFKQLNGVLYIPPDGVMRESLILIDKLAEALKAFELQKRCPTLWDDTQVEWYISQDATKDVEKLCEYSLLACDIETRNLDYDGNKLLLLGVAYARYKVVIFDLSDAMTRAQVQKLFDSPHIDFMWHGGKFDVTRLAYLGGINARIDEDTMLQHYAYINERKGTHGLKDLGELYLQAPAWDEELDNYKRKWCAQNRVTLKTFQYDMLPLETFYKYLARDCCATFQLFEVFNSLGRKSAYPLYRMLIRAANVLKDVELAGCLVDQDYLYELQDKLDDYILEAEAHLRSACRDIWDPIKYARETGARSVPKAFNYKSPKQLCWMMQKVTGEKLTSTKKEVLEMLIEKYPDTPFISAIAELRKYTKYMDTYVQGIQEILCSDGRVRCTFKLHGTETGRLSCEAPNMQNVPRSKLIKNLFVAPAGYKLMQFDYSQAELRALAWLSQDVYLRETYRKGQDLHDAMALKIFGENFTKEQRVAAKTVNFGIPYGRGPGSMASKLHMTYGEAARIIQDWYKAAPEAKSFVDAMRKSPYKNGEPYTTIFGRQRHYIITSENRNHVENEAVNFPISSVASDLTLLSTCEIHDALLAKNLDARIVNTVHDSIVLEVRDDPETLQQVKQLGVRIMSDIPKVWLRGLDFPFIADAEIGQSWGDLENADTAIEQEMVSE